MFTFCVQGYIGLIVHYRLRLAMPKKYIFSRLILLMYQIWMQHARWTYRANQKYQNTLLSVRYSGWKCFSKYAMFFSTEISFSTPWSVHDTVYKIKQKVLLVTRVLKLWSLFYYVSSVFLWISSEISVGVLLIFLTILLKKINLFYEIKCFIGWHETFPFSRIIVRISQILFWLCPVKRENVS